MKVFKTILRVIITIVVVLLVIKGIELVISEGIAKRNSSGDSMTLKNDTSQTRADYKKIGMNACVSEATKGDDAVTLSEANQYCKCTVDKIYIGTLADMQAMDAAFDKNGFTAAQEQVILDCAGAVYQ